MLPPGGNQQNFIWGGSSPSSKIFLNFNRFGHSNLQEIHSSSILPFADEEGGSCVLLLFADFTAGSPEVGGFLSVFSFSLESGAAAFEGLEDLPGVVLFPSDPPKRSDSISSSP